MGVTVLLDPNPPLFPAATAVAWGEDTFGLWQAFELSGVRQVMRWIVPGQFLMGSPADELQRFEDELQHPVTLSQGFWLAESACSQALWKAVMGENPSGFSNDPQHPVNSVSWNDCQAFITKANTLLPVEWSLRLPSEAEWEYACRAGSQSAFSWGDSLTTDQANFDGNRPYADSAKGEYRKQVLPVLSFRPNALGLYQMHGNVWEWCADWRDDYPEGKAVNPVGPSDGRGRVLRGGSWFDSGRFLRSAQRFASTPDDRFHGRGLRLAGG